MRLVIEFDPDKTAIADAVTLLEQVRDLLFSFLEIAQAQTPKEIKGVVLETLVDVYGQGTHYGMEDHLPPAIEKTSFHYEWEDFCTAYQVPIKTYRSVDRGMKLRGETSLTLATFLSAGPVYWTLLRNVGDKAANDIEAAKKRWEHRYSATENQAGTDAGNS